MGRGLACDLIREQRLLSATCSPQAHFLQPFEGIGYGMNVGIVLDPSRANFNGGANGTGTFYLGGVHRTWFRLAR